MLSHWPDALKLLQTAVQIELVKEASYNLIRYTFRPLIKKNNYICLSPVGQSPP